MENQRLNQGDIYWIYPNPERYPELGTHPHPYVILQENLFNHSRIRSVVVCAISTNLRFANQYGNVLLDEQEGGLPKQSVVVVSKLSAVDKSILGEQIGTLSAERIAQIIAGIQLQQNSFG